jgi:hypothetical protein
MEPERVDELAHEYGHNRVKVICPDIPGVCNKNAPWLVSIPENKLHEHLAQEGLI